ncbi:MAG: NUDIX domain-containing protein [Ignavibacteria bacterium]
MKLATLLYIINTRGEYLLMKRLKSPNKGLMSPPGGKLDIISAESPLDCSIREAFEECHLTTCASDWKLRGILTEKDYPDIGNIMIFLMELKFFIDILPKACNEGEFFFIHPDDFNKYEIPVTDKLFLWNRIIMNYEEPFIISLDCKYYPDIQQVNV